ncbi:MAG: hypothetical protein ACFBRM_14760 [Pikeienuella sp.]
MRPLAALAIALCLATAPAAAARGGGIVAINGGHYSLKSLGEVGTPGGPSTARAERLSGRASVYVEVAGLYTATVSGLLMTLDSADGARSRTHGLVVFDLSDALDTDRTAGALFLALDAETDGGADGGQTSPEPPRFMLSGRYDGGTGMFSTATGRQRLIFNPEHATFRGGGGTIRLDPALVP